MLNKEEAKKSLKFLIDESTGKKLFDFLSLKGFNVKFVTYVMPGASDEKILDFAEKEKSILITNDKDFGKLVFGLKKPTYGVILLRLKQDSQKNRQNYVSYLLDNFYNSLENRFIVVSEEKVRMRKNE